MKILRIIAKIGKYFILALMGLLSIVGVRVTIATTGNYFYDLKKKGLSREEVLATASKESFIDQVEHGAEYAQRFMANGAKGFNWILNRDNY